MDLAKIQELEVRLWSKFKKWKELYRALMHSAFSKEEKDRNIGARDCSHQATYATLGDAILKVEFILLLKEKYLKTKGNITISKADLENNLHHEKVWKQLRATKVSLGECESFCRHD